jgi:uncharacterized protein YjbI with pentapeptide repeats
MSAITSITGLQNLTSLQRFYADWNYLTSVDLSGLTSLIEADISDCEEPGTNANSLTSVNLTGCTALENLRLDDSDFSAGIPNLSSLTSLQFFDMDQCNISGAVDISQLPTSFYGFDLSGNNITSVQLPETNLTDVNLANTALTETGVNNILQWLDGSGVTSGYADLSGGTSAPPSGNGIIAKNNLIGKGWTVNVNLGPAGSIDIAPSTDFDIVGNYTIEMFVNMSNLNGFPRPYSFGAYPAPNAMSIEGGQLYFWANGSALMNGSFNPNVGQWYHICAQRSGSTNYLYIDGVQIATAVNSANIPSQGLPLTIGYGNEPNSYFNGLISNFKWTPGVNYNVNGFTVPNGPLDVTVGTKLLIFQGATLEAQLTDNSGNGHNATNAGASFSTSDPFNGIDGSLQMGNA